MNNIRHTGELLAETPTMATAFVKLRAMYQLTKPGITRMVVLSTTAGYFLAIPQLNVLSLSEQILHFILTVLGTSLTCAGSCVLNNYIERNQDKMMKRTMMRGTTNGTISPTSALVLGIVLCLLGLVALSAINTITLVLALLTIITYVAIYTPLKRVTTVSLLIGAIPGALPPMGGWTSVTGTIDMAAIVLFAILFLWQLPHFLALSWMYKKDYERGGFKMTAVYDESGKSVAGQMILYCVILLLISPILTLVGVTGYIYFACSCILGFVFLYYAIRFYGERTHDRARNALLSSYVFLTGVIMVMFLDKQ